MNMDCQLGTSAAHDVAIRKSTGSSAKWHGEGRTEQLKLPPVAMGHNRAV